MKIVVVWQKTLLSPEALKAHLAPFIGQQYSIEEAGHLWKITFTAPSVAEALFCRDAVLTVLKYARRQNDRVSIVVSRFESDGGI